MKSILIAAAITGLVGAVLILYISQMDEQKNIGY